MAGTLPPLFTITHDDHAGYIAVATYTFLVLMVFLVITRVFTRWYVVRYIKGDDALLVLAMVLGIIQSICIQMALDHGLGRRRKLVSPHDFDLYQKYEYAAQILLVATIAVAKMSLSYLLQTMMSDRRTILASRALLGVVVAWALASIFALAFQCSLPAPWDNSRHCVDQALLHYTIGAFNIATDVALIILPCVVFWTVHNPMKRLQVVSLFSIRIIAIVVTAIQLSHIAARFRNGVDETWQNINSSIWDQIMMNASIFSTALPSLGRLIVDFQPDVNTFAMTDRHRPQKQPGEHYAFANTFGHRFSPEYVLSHHLGAEATIGSRNRGEDSESVQGLREDGLQQNQNVIQQTVGFEVKYTSET